MLIDIGYLYTKFDDFRFSRSSDMIGASRILMGHMTWPRPYQGHQFIVGRLWLAQKYTINLYIKFEVYAITNYEDAYGNAIDIEVV